jgi:hypothetical protein
MRWIDETALELRNIAVGYGRRRRRTAGLRLAAARPAAGFLASSDS